MANYAVFLEGKNFELSRGGFKELFGFFVTVRVEAPSEHVAGVNATTVLKSDAQLAEAFKEGASETPQIEVKVVHELLPENKMKNTEFVFFSMKETDF